MHQLLTRNEQRTSIPTLSNVCPKKRDKSFWCKNVEAGNDNGAFSHRLTVLRYFEAVTHCGTFGVTVSFPVSRCGVGTDEARLWKRHTGRHPIVPARPSPGGHECSGSTCLSVKSLWSRHPAASSPALAPCTGMNFVHASSSGLPVHSWTWAGLPDRYLTVNLGFGCKLRHG